VTYLLVLIYSGLLSIAAEPRADLQSCVEEAGKRVGEELKVVAWDNMGGSNPIPRIVLAFCVPGATNLK
jgi:hypothetical protein